MKYILNSAVITTPGYYHYRLISLKEAQEWLRTGNWESTIGYQETADALQQLTGIEIPVNKQQIQMRAGDTALVFRLTTRITGEMKGSVGTDWILKHCEIGILRKLKS